MIEKLENSLIFNNHFVLGVYDKWEEKIDIGKYTENLTKCEKSILYLFWEKIVFERYPDIKDEPPIVLNNILRVMVINKSFKKSLIERIVYLIKIKELDNDFDFMATLSIEFDDILTHLEKEYDLFVIANKEDKYVYMNDEQFKRELSYEFSAAIDYPN